jgi:uncharacterized membrane protein
LLVLLFLRIGKSRRFVLTALPRLAGVIALGLFLVGLRFFHLAEKPFWLDEAFTAFHLSGYPDDEVNRFVLGQIRSASDMLQFQQVNGHHGWVDMVQHILETAPELPPLYFLLLRGWSYLFGPSVAAMRGFSALFGALLLPVVYWFCWVAFRDRRVGLLAVVLIGLSPFHLLLSQEARPYTLWLVEVMVANLALVQADRSGRRRHWLLYTVTMVLAFYTHLLTMLLLLGQAVAVLWGQWSAAGKSQQSTWKGFAVSNLVAGAAILPWIWLGFLRPQAFDEHAYVVPGRPLPDLIKGLVRGLSIFFVDLGLNETSPKHLLLLLAPLVAVVFIALAGAVIHAKHRDLWSIRLLLTLGILPPSLIFVSDLGLQGIRSLSVRYFSFSHMMLEILLALALVQSLNPRLRRWRSGLIATLVLMGLISNLTYFRSPSWWHKTLTQDDRCIATVTTPLSQPLLITDEFFVRAAALSHGVKPQLRFQILPRGDRHPQLPKQLTQQAPPGQTYLYLPSEALRQAVSQRYDLENTCGKAMIRLRDRG